MQLMSTLNNSNNGAGHSTFLGNVRGEKGNDTAFRTPDGPFFGSWSGYSTNWVDWSVNGNGLELQRLLACSERVIRGEYPGIFSIHLILDLLTICSSKKDQVIWPVDSSFSKP